MATQPPFENYAHEFILKGGTLPRNNGYLLLSALSVEFPFLHGRSDLQIAPVRGTRMGGGAKIQLDSHSVLHIRGLNDEEAALLSGSWVLVQGLVVAIGCVSRREIKTSPRLVTSRLIFRDVFEAKDVTAAIHKALGDPSVTVKVGRRSTLRLKGRNMLGHSVVLSNLSPTTSLRIQREGLGLCTSMGCGVFYPGTLTA